MPSGAPADDSRLLARHGFACGPVTTVEGGELAVKVWTAKRLPTAVAQIGGAGPATGLKRKAGSR